MSGLLLDLRCASRALRARPGYAAAAVLTLALAIGTNAAMFAVVRAVLLRPLPYPEPERLVWVGEANPSQGGESFEVSTPNFRDWSEAATSFESLGAAVQYEMTLRDRQDPARVPLAFATASYFRTLGIAPAIGGGFTAAEDLPSARHAAVLGHRLWVERFASDPGVVGSSLTLDGNAFEVIGVMPAGFVEDTALWLPYGIVAEQFVRRDVHVNRVVGRLRPGVDLRQAQAELDRLTAAIAREHPAEDPLHAARLEPLQERIVGGSRPALAALWAAVVVVLLIACANLASLLLARWEARLPEASVRLALGASRWRLARQVLCETALLFAAGAGAGLLLASQALDLLRLTLAATLPRGAEIRTDLAVVGFTLAAAAASMALAVLAPALRVGRAAASFAEQGHGRGGVRHAGRSGLVVAQVALAAVLLVGALLLGRSLARLGAVDPGFDPGGLLTAKVTLPADRYPDAGRAVATFAAIVERLRAAPGVVAASAVSDPPISGGDSLGALTIEGRPFAPGAAPEASYRRVLPTYFQAMGIPLHAGREFGTAEGTDGETAVVAINETMARRYWPEGDAVGSRIKVGPAESEPWLTVVGVVGDVRNVDVASEPALATYEPLAQRPRRSMNLVVRTAGDPGAVATSLRALLREVEPGASVSDLGTMEQRLARSVAPQRLQALLAAGFAALATLLAAGGLYALLSFVVQRRTREIGIRMALGARPATVLGGVLGDGLRLAAAGLALGLAAGLGLTRFLEGQLFGVRPADPAAFAAAACLLLGAALAACWLPARRATRVEPMAALRAE